MGNEATAGPARHSSPWERWCFLSLSIPALVYVALRAYHVPMVHDEVRTFHLFVLTGDFVPFVAEWDAANHLLLTALAQVGYFLFGDSPLALRGWSVIAYALYLFYAWRMGGWFDSVLVRWCLWAALVLTPFQIEFFGLFRGYALGLGLMLMAVFHSVSFAREGRSRDAQFALASAVLAASAMLSLLISVSVVFALVLFFIRRRKAEAGHRTRLIHWCAWLVPFFTLVWFAAGLSKRGLLYFGSKEGLFNGTFRSLCQMVLGNAQLSLMIGLLVVLALVSCLGIRSLMRPSEQGHGPALAIVMLIFLGTLVGQEFLGLSMGMLYPLDRSALQLLPFSCLLFALASDRLARFRGYAGLVASPLLFFPYRTVCTANLDHTSYWPEQSIPDGFFSLAAERQRVSGRTLLIHGGVYQVQTWNFGVRRSGYPLNDLDQSVLPLEWYDLILIDTTTFPVPDGFRSLATGSGGHITLCENQITRSCTTLLERSFSRAASHDGYTVFLDTTAGSWRGRSIVVDAEGRITSLRGTLASWIFVKVVDINGEHLFYRAYEVDHQRGTTLDGPFRMAARFPVDSAAVRVSFGLWSTRGRSLALEDVHLRVSTMTP